MNARTGVSLLGVRLRRSIFTFLGLLILLSFETAPLRAQEFRATLSGAVSDPSGGTIPNAVVTALENSTRLTYTGRTNSTGWYYIPYVLPGTYTMTVEAKGFRTLIQKNVAVTTAQSQGLNFNLEVGALSERRHLFWHWPCASDFMPVEERSPGNSRAASANRVILKLQSNFELRTTSALSFFSWFTSASPGWVWPPVFLESPSRKLWAAHKLCQLLPKSWILRLARPGRPSRLRE